jgi:hypothetical protein
MFAVGCGTSVPTSAPTPAPTAAGPSSGPTSGTTQAPFETAPPSPSPLPPAVLAPCAAADLKASHGDVEGAAGSQFTEVVLVSAIACSVDRYPSLGLRDANGAALVGGIPGGIGRLDLVAGAPYVSVVRLANWCREVEPAFPLALEIRVGAEAVIVSGDPFPAEGETPPCTGEGLPPTLESGAWSGTELRVEPIRRPDPRMKRPAGERRDPGRGARRAFRSGRSAP